MKSLSQVVFLAICMCCMSKREKVAFFLDENVFVRVTMFALTWWRINKLIKEWQAYHSVTCLFLCFEPSFTFIEEIYIQGITAFQHFVRWPLSWILSLWALVHWRDYIINNSVAAHGVKCTLHYFSKLLISLVGILYRLALKLLFY